MRSKFLTSAAALALTATAVLATAGPASAQRWHRHFGWGLPGLVVGGAVAAATSPLWAPGYYGYYGNYYPRRAYTPGYAYDDSYAYAPGYTYGTAPGYTYAPGAYEGGPYTPSRSTRAHRRNRDFQDGSRG